MIAHESQPNGSSAGPSRDDPGPYGQQSPPNDPAAEKNPLAPLLAHLAELREYAAYYLSTQADSVKLGLRSTALKAVLGCVGLIMALSLVATAAVLLLSGTANGLAVLLGDRLWAGQLITGLVVLAATAGGAYLGVQSMLKSSRKRTIDKYERRQQQQRFAFGHDVRQRAEPPPR